MDPHEGGLRKALNFGHTVGHAIEILSHELGEPLTHGEAVAIGLIFAAELAHRLGRINADRVAEHRRVVGAYELPLTLPSGLQNAELVALMGRDKKALDGITFVLDGPNGVESVTGVEISLIEDSIDAIRALSLIMRTENKEDPTYLVSRRVVSDGVAKRLALDPVQLNRAWSRAPRDHQIAVLSALTQLGVPYIEGKEDSYVKMDCSGLLWFSWRTAGVDMPRQAVSQLDRRMRVDREDAMAGDITGEGTHVQMYLGTGLAMIHAQFGGKFVKFKIMSAEQAARVVWTNPSNIATFRL
jgi:hypothetical protein